MFKMKMIALMNNKAFKSSMIILAIIAIVTGIIVWPKSDADTQINVAFRAATMKVYAGSKDLMMPEVGPGQDDLANKKAKYSTLYCIDEGTDLSYGVYKKEINFYNAAESSKYFKNYNAATWMFDNMFVLRGINAQDSLNYIANLVTSDDVKAKVTAYGNISANDIKSLNKTIGDGRDSSGNVINRNLLEVVQQLVLWNFTNNKSNINPDHLVNAGISGSNINNNDQNKIKYFYYALKYLATKDPNYTSNGTKSNVVSLDASNAKIDVNEKRVGPYYLKSNGSSISINNEYQAKISAKVVKVDGSEQNLGSDKVIIDHKSNAFFINTADCGSIKKSEVNVADMYSGAKTTVEVIVNGSNQNLINIRKEATKTPLKDVKEISYSGKYNINLIKVKKDGTTVIENNPAEFKITGAVTLDKALTGNNGILEIAKEKAITSVSANDVYEIEETVAPNGFVKYDGKINLSVKFKQEGTNFILDKDNITLNSNGTNGTVKLNVPNNNTIEIYVPNNEEEKGEYSIKLIKVEEDGTTVVENNPAEFKITGAVTLDKAVTNNKGILDIVSNRKIESVDATEKYVIEEKNAPKGFEPYNGKIELEVKFTKSESNLILDKNNTKIKADGTNGTVELKMPTNSIIEIYVPNKEDRPEEFDLSLRKFISKIDDVKPEISRAPELTPTSYTTLVKYKTAAYFHTKKSLQVNIGSKVEYTIRVYNEGDIDGYAKEITDYIPEGLKFIKIADESAKMYKTDAKADSKKIVIKYLGNENIKANSIGRIVLGDTTNVYQEVKIICEVTENAKGYITSRAEITNYGYEKDGKWLEAVEINKVDRDSVQNTIENNLSLDTWYENAKEYIYPATNKVMENYYPGVQDDDDFETVEVIERNGKYTINIKKVDSSNKNQGLKGAYFGYAIGDLNELSKNANAMVTGPKVGPTDENGFINVVKDVEIKSANDKVLFNIKELTAPEGYNGYDKLISFTFETTVVNNKYVVNDSTVKLSDDNKDSISIDSKNSVITITIPNDKKEFDLSLRKFITNVNNTEITSRIPQVTITDEFKNGYVTTAKYDHPKDPVEVCTNDIVTYTIRVYNEGAMAGYASKVMDDIPEGLEYLPDNKVNTDNKWKMYAETNDSNATNTIKYAGKVYAETNDAKKADLLVTDALKDELIKEYNPKTMNELDFKDVQVAFKVIEPAKSNRVLINYAQITECKDFNKELVDDRDSIPNEWNEGEDDQDIEKLKVRYFDLALRKWVTQAIVTENGVTKVTETGHKAEDNPEEIVKVDLKKSVLGNVTVKFRYSIRVTNQGEIEGYAKEIVDFIPNGLKFVQEDNPDWMIKDGRVVTRALENTLLKPGESAEVSILLTWINDTKNMGVMVNIAEISEDYNKFNAADIDSTPDNQKPNEDDIDDAPVMLTVKTGSDIIYVVTLGLGFLVIIAAGVVLIKKHIN